jgi:hypothetical protein
MILNLTLASTHTSLIIAGGILNPTLAYLPCSKALHMKCRLLPEDITSRRISGLLRHVREMKFCLRLYIGLGEHSSNLALNYILPIVFP